MFKKNNKTCIKTRYLRLQNRPVGPVLHLNGFRLNGQTSRYKNKNAHENVCAYSLDAVSLEDLT